METSSLLILILGGIGVLNTLYLVSHVISKKPVKCIGFPQESCNKVQTSKYSRTFGIPNPISGLVMYSFLVFSVLMFNAELMPFWPTGLVIVIGFLFSVYFTIIQAYVIKAFCTWCVLSAIDFFLLFFVLLTQLV